MTFSALCSISYFAFCSDLYDPRLPNNKKHRAAILQMGIILHGVYDSNFPALATYDTTSSTRLLHTATFFHSHCCISPHLADLSVLRFATPISIANCTNNFCNHVAREKSVVKWKKNLYNKSAGNCYSVVTHQCRAMRNCRSNTGHPAFFMLASAGLTLCCC